MAYSVPLGAKRTLLYRVGGSDSSRQVAPPFVDENTPPSFAPWNATARSLGASGLASTENRLSSEIPLEDCTKVFPASVERKTARELVPRNKSVDVPGTKRKERPANAPVPPMPISQVAPPSVVRLTPLPSMATETVCASFGSTAMDSTTNTGQVLS